MKKIYLCLLVLCIAIIAVLAIYLPNIYMAQRIASGVAYEAVFQASSNHIKLQDSDIIWEISDWQHWAETIRSFYPAKQHQIGAISIEEQWNKLIVEGKIVYDIVKDFQQQKTDAVNSYVSNVWEKQYELLSCVGNVISYSDSNAGYGEGAAHPYAFIHFYAINTETLRPCNLTEIVTKKSLAKALKQNAFLRKFFPQQQILDAAESLEDVHVLLSEFVHDCAASWTSANPFESFAICDYSKDKNILEVSLFLQYESEVCRGMYQEIKLQVTPEERWQKKYLQNTKNFLWKK